MKHKPLPTQTREDDDMESWAKLIAKIGATSAIALYAFWLLGDRYDKRLANVEVSTAATAAAVTQHATDAKQLGYAINRLVNVQLAQCINTADDYKKREKCVDALEERPTTGDR